MNWFAALAIVPLLVPQDARRGLAVDEEQDEAPASATYRRRHAVIVGIDDYRDPAYKALKCAVADAQAVAQMLLEKYRFDEVRLLLDGEATKAGLEKVLEEWACDPDRVDERDLVVIFFAGHGVTRADWSGREHGYLVPVDATYSARRGNPAWSSLVGMRDLEEISELIPAKHVLFVLDCCFSGQFGRRNAPPIAAGLGSRARQVISAGDADESAIEGLNGSSHSVFTDALLDALRGAADANGDRVVTFGELFDYVGTTVPAVTGNRQTPQQVNLLDHEGGNVAFFPPGVQPGRNTVGERIVALERTTEEQLDEIERFSDALLILELEREAETLWPQVPEMAPRYQDWLGRARRLARRRALHEDALRRAREEARLELVQQGRLTLEGGGGIAWDDVDAKLHWRHDTLQRMLEGLDRLGRTLVDVDRRLNVATNLRRRSIDEHADAWARAVEAIQNHPSYAGLVLEPQLGLVPLGPDPRSELWEFAHLVSGELPERDASGELTVTEATGVVLVLVYGGTLTMGAQAADVDGPNYDALALADEGPPHEVALDAFLIAKHELTQGQWSRFAGANPSAHDVGTDPASGKAFGPLQPVESVSRHDCETWLARMGLALPTEAQWEYAARAGSGSAWITGRDPSTLAGHANVADLALMEAQEGTNPSGAHDFDDGWYRPAPVGTYAPNAFGLHDVIGNVMEWTGDSLAPFDVAARPGTGLRSAPTDAEGVVRGGAWDGGPSYGRSACRIPMSPGGRVNNVGVRPTCPIR